MEGGGVGDAYGEDRATEEQLITPWAFSVARLRAHGLSRVTGLRYYQTCVTDEHDDDVTN
jgi:hypothetical protein